MSDKSARSVGISGFLWMFLERCGAQGVGLIVSIVLARQLNPSDYGVVSIISVFITFLTMFISSGMSVALVQKKDADELDFCSLFYFNLIVCFLLYLVLFFLSPTISQFYNMPELENMMRVNALMFFVSGLRGVQAAYCSRHLLFKNFFFATLGGTIGAAILGIYMAYQGFGAWALIAQNLFNNAIDAVILWFTVKWRPKRMFSFIRLKTLFKFGWRMLVSSLLELVYNNLYPLIIGKVYSSEDLAYYTKGQTLPSSIIAMINTSLDKVLLPVMANEQDDIERVKQMTRCSLQLGTFVLFPLIIGFAACADNIVRVLLTEKWIEVVPYMQIFCVVYLFLPIQTANLNAIKAVGRSDIYLKLDIVKRAIGIVTLLITLRFGVLYMALGQIIVNLLGQVVNCYPNKKLLGYSISEQCRDIVPSFALSAAMGLCVVLLGMIPLSPTWKLLVQIGGGMCIYIVLSQLIHLEAYTYIIDAIKLQVTRHKG